MGWSDFKVLVLAHANRAAGPRRVATNLIRALANLGPGVEVTAVMPSDCGYETITEDCRLTPIWFDQRGSRLRRLAFDAVQLPRIACRHRPNAILALGSIGLARPPVPQAVLVQDAHFVYPSRQYGCMSTMERLRYSLQRRQVRSSIDRSSIVYCQTPVMVERVREVYRNARHVRILPKYVPHLPSEARILAGTANPLRAYEGRFRLIYLSYYYPHKNMEILCDVFERYGDLLKGVVAFLTVAADQHSHARDLLRRIERRGLSSQIVNLGPIPQERIPSYLLHCHGLLFPTKMESYSAAYLDAMQCGLPILTSDLDFARGICGEAACYFDPCSPGSIARAIARLRGDCALQRQLAERSRRRLGELCRQPWEEIAADVVLDLRACEKISRAQVSSRGIRVLSQGT